MITGDHPATGKAIADKLGILGERQVITGPQLGEKTSQEVIELVDDIGVYARTSPEQKLDIVQAWKARGEIVAMTGDGVNDAPALRTADIGIAMGVTGTEVAKEAADMVLTDDNFATILTAVGEGRRIYDNIRRFVRYTLTSNSGEIWVMFLGPFIGLPLPLLPVHILWINLVTDGLPGLALGVEPAERNIMQRPPRPPNESIFARGLWQTRCRRRTDHGPHSPCFGLVGRAGRATVADDAVYHLGPAATRTCARREVGIGLALEAWYWHESLTSCSPWLARLACKLVRPCGHQPVTC